MSTANEDSPVYDGSAQTGYALGALFGMILFNVALAAVALILRRISRQKNNAPGNSVELKTGTFDKRTNVNEDVESSTRQQVEPNGMSTVTGDVQSAENFETIQHDNGAFVDIDLDKDDPVYENPDKVDETSEDYTTLNEIKTEIPTDDPAYQNVETGSPTVVHNESNICY